MALSSAISEMKVVGLDSLADDAKQSIPPEVLKARLETFRESKEGESDFAKTMRQIDTILILLTSPGREPYLEMIGDFMRNMDRFKIRIRLDDTCMPEQIEALEKKVSELMAVKKMLLEQILKGVRENIRKELSNEEKIKEAEDKLKYLEHEFFRCDIHIKTAFKNTQTLNAICKFVQHYPLSFLVLKKSISRKKMDKIIFAFRNSSLIGFRCPRQCIPNRQAKRLLHYAKTAPKGLELIFDGTKLSNKTAVEFAKVSVRKERRIVIRNNDYFSRRKKIEDSICSAKSTGYFNLSNKTFFDDVKAMDYSSDDLVRLGRGFSEYKGGIDVSIVDKDYSYPGATQALKPFFTDLFSNSNVTYFALSSEVKMEDALLLHMLSCIGTNRTLDHLRVERGLDEKAVGTLAQSLRQQKALNTIYLKLHDNMTLRQLMDALSDNPESPVRDVLLRLSYEEKGIGDSIKRLLQQNRVTYLFLGDLSYTTTVLTALAESLAGNTSLVRLGLEGYSGLEAFSGLPVLARAIAQHPNVRKLEFTIHSRRVTPALNDFIQGLSPSTSLRELSIHYYNESKDSHREVKEYIKQASGFLHRNIKQEFVATAMALYQARFKLHPVLLRVLDFLAPSVEVATMDESRRRVSLIRDNMSRRQQGIKPWWLTQYTTTWKLPEFKEDWFSQPSDAKAVVAESDRVVTCPGYYKVYSVFQRWENAADKKDERKAVLPIKKPA